MDHHSEKQQSMNNLEIDEVENSNRVEEFDDTSSSSSEDNFSYDSVSSGGECTSGETDVVQWLLALDLQVMGACRVDERLKPLLKLNVSTDAAEDRLLAYLSQNFEPSEVGMLARCLCIPLVSMRVGKIKKQGTLLRPTTTRGNLNLAILPTSELSISFIGDDGRTARVGTFDSESDCAAVEIKDIVSDQSGRSFLINITDGETSYFWCSEKSQLLGDELRRKMRDLLKKKPSLVELTGIDESRLDCFAIHLRAYLLGSAATNPQASSILSRDPSADGSVNSSELGLNAQISVVSQKPLLPQHFTGLRSNTSLMSSLSPISSAFKDRYLSCVDCQIAGTSSTDTPISNCVEEDKLGRETGPSNVLEPLVTCPPFRDPAATIHSLDSTVFSPYYCWCPPAVSTPQYSVGTPNLPILSTDSLSVPLLSSIAPACPSSILTPKPPLVTDLSSFDFPALLPEPVFRLPLSLATSQQISSFTPFVCDPIVHIPVIDVCSSGQGYLVSAGPAISGTIPQLHPNLVNPLLPETDSVAEKSARETLRLLINNSNQPSPQLIDLLPPVLSRSEETQNMLVSGSRGLYSGTIDIDTIANGFAIKGLVSLYGRPVGLVEKKQTSIEKLVLPMEKPGSSGESSLDEGYIDFEEERKK
ncbi:uncharacterized protein [Nicotiana sylvestris]|uniref:Uncharacterized protein LOC104238636 n=1 Tax=Nicotiana sylvestris TaxID=4096 RepID=A0A1U7XWP4_NICSY|nr:PREDICTED: uncharacterized protein LOC104238636 [Nicotiana sylvestris]